MRAKLLIIFLLFSLTHGCPLAEVKNVSESCTPGETEKEKCGNCGVRERTCTEEGWSSWSDCREEGACKPGEKREAPDGPCGDCGHKVYTCLSSCEWNKGDCTDEGACTPGDIESRENRKGKKEVRECGADCSWGRWMDLHQLDGYEDARFGMSKEEVLTLYEKQGPRVVEDKIVVKVAYQGEKTPHVFEFKDDELYAVSIIFSGEDWKKAAYIDKYNKLLGELREKYGDPPDYDHDQEYPTYCLWKGQSGNLLLWLDKKGEDGYFLMIRIYDPHAQKSFLQQKTQSRNVKEAAGKG